MIGIYAKAFSVLTPGSRWRCQGDMNVYENYIWLDNRPQPSKKACDSIIPDILRDEQITNAQELRRVAYQHEADPLFFKAQAGEDGVTLGQWESKRQEIKDRYPYSTT